MTLDDEVLRELARVVKAQRVYAPIREGGTKRQKELGAVKDLLESMQRAGEHRYHDATVSPEDPPDCVAHASNGEPVAFEVSELVSQTAVELNERARPAPGERPDIVDMVMHRWEESDFLERVTGILATKDTKSFKGGPFREIAVLIHTDEPLLMRHQCEAWLAGHTFGPFNQITHAYMLFPYEPGEGYPYQRLFGAA